MDRSKHTSSRDAGYPWPLPDRRLAAPTVLVVEDDADIREMLSVLLDLAELSTIMCGTAEGALELLREQHVDLVLTDYALPGRSGLWLLDCARREGLIRDTPVLVVTAHPEPAGLAGYEVIQKPFDLDELVERVRQRLGQRRSSAPRSLPAAPRGPASRQGGGDGDGECPEPVELIVYVPQGAKRHDGVEQMQKILSRFTSPRVKLTVCEVPRGAGGASCTPGQVLMRRGAGPQTFILGHLSNPDLLLELLNTCGREPEM
ncbi:MAG TPA: response regulator [Vicinamibacterales bacterium]|nr:response regulator [Vicinamibacterales bacterium]